jgi:predicted SprT family Zn-dependent metalloprotease
MTTIQLEDKVLTIVQAMVEEAIEKHLPNKGWSFEWDRAKRRMGCCHYSTKKITMSPTLVLNATKKQIQNTILHEVAHAMAGWDAGHGYMWKRQARQIGCDAMRCHSVDTSSGAKYTAKCSGCGNSFHKFRMPKYGLTGRQCRKCKIELKYHTV